MWIRFVVHSGFHQAVQARVMASKAAQVTALVVRLLVPAGKATPTPPVGPALGSKGVKAMDFCKEFNARTAHYNPGTPIPCIVTVAPDRTFTFETRSPPVSWLIKQTAGVEKGSGTANSSAPIGKISLKQVYEIAKIKCQDESLAMAGEQAVAKSVIGSARSIGIEVVP